MPTSRRVSSRRPYRRALALAGAMACALGLSACGSTIASLPLVGEPAESQASRPAATPAYPDAFAKTGTDAKPMTPAERAKLEAELTAARDQSAAQRREEISRPNAR